MIDRELWSELRGFDPTFFMYGDEVDLCIRAKKKGAAPKITPRATIIHHGGGSEPSSEDKLIKVFKGRVTVMNHHWSPLAAWIGRIVMVLGVGLRSLANAIVSSPGRKGGGQDGETKVWKGAFKRRREWSDGWEVVSR